MMLDLEPQFLELETPKGKEGSFQFAAQSIPGYVGFRIAKDSSSRPCILINAEKMVMPTPSSAPIVLKHLRVLPRVKCRIIHDGGHTEEGNFSVLSCISDDPRLHKYFLRIGSVVISSLSTEPKHEELLAVFNSLVDLFRSLSNPSRKSLQGLWAELFVIERSHNPGELVRSWHIFPEDRYDFSKGKQRLEVKSTAGRSRQHMFSLEQLIPPADTIAVVASVIIERAGGGVSIDQLVQSIASRLISAEEILHLELTVAKTLGELWDETREDCFDYELAKQTLEFFDTRSVPSISHDSIPPEISHVRFQSNLDGTPPINRLDYRRMGGIFKAAL